MQVQTPMSKGMWAFLALMTAHWAEHIVQVYQVYVLHMHRACALGLLGMKYPWLVRTESLHFTFAVLTTVMLIALRKRFVFEAYTLWDIAISISLWHLLEHSLLFYQAVTGHFLFGAHQPTSILQLAFPRIELHLFYNSLVTIPSMIAMWINTFKYEILYPVPVEPACPSSDDVCGCGPKWVKNGTV
jgi:hypothetical protein